MKNCSVPVLLALALATSLCPAADPVSTVLTYQGKLLDAGVPASGEYDFEFRLFDASVGGLQKGATDLVSNAMVMAGIFTVQLDFGAQYNGEARWLQIGVRPGISAGAYTTLTTRQALTGAPYALGVRLPLSESGSSASPLLSLTNISSVGHTISAISESASSVSLSGFANTAVLGNSGTGNGVVGLTSSSGSFGVSGQADGSGTTSVRGFHQGTSGNAGLFIISSTSNTSSVVNALTVGTGAAGTFTVSNTSNPDNALEVTTNGNADSQALSATHNGLGDCGLFTITNVSSVGEAVEASTNGGGYSIQAVTTGTNRAGYFQINNSANDNSAIYATTNGSGGVGVEGFSTASTSIGVQGTGLSAGVKGFCGSTNGAGVYGVSTAGGNGGGSGVPAGVRGDGSAAGVAGVQGFCNPGTGVYGQTSSGNGIFGTNGGSNTTGHAGYFNGRVHIQGTLSKSGGSFKIDHPLDPANKYLFHSFVESPDMKNIYDGVVTLDDNGGATITMPDYFSALNAEFRYQLTCIGGYAPVYISSEIKGNTFCIGGGKAGLKVSWMLTGVRQDAYATYNRIKVEEDKASDEKGRFLFPQGFGKPASEAIGALPALHN